VISIRRSLRVPTLVSGLVLGVIAAPAACATRSNESLGIATTDRDASLSFVGDGGTGDCTAEGGCDAGLVQYCPVTECPDPYATCASSRFACDVNLLNDPHNCGACGFSCDIGGSDYATYTCVEGKCTLSCTRGAADCNNLPDDDCETKLGTNNACAACGDVCPDPAKPCVDRHDGTPAKCGCEPGETRCGSFCVDTQSNDITCGSCTTICAPTPSDGGTLPPNVYLGCQNGECGHPKCQSGWADCDGKSDNGCETNLLLPTSCGACTTVCDPEQNCLVINNKPTCFACPLGQTLCGNNCTDIVTDSANCGGCGNNCNSANIPAGVVRCAYGSCRYDCMQGRGDCNSDTSDGCETNLNADPRNCGECGNACDIAGGQPCIGGRCAVEPCHEEGATTQ
jgi:hypothetical protein